MKLEPYDYRDPGEVVTHVASTHDIGDGDVLLVVVRDPSTDQVVEHVRCLDRQAWNDLDEFDLPEYLAQQFRSLPIPPRNGQLRYSVVIVVARLGFAMLGRHELRWLHAWRFSNHFVDTFSGVLVVLTDHGWYDFSTEWGGHEPRLSA